MCTTDPATQHLLTLISQHPPHSWCQYKKERANPVRPSFKLFHSPTKQNKPLELACFQVVTYSGGQDPCPRVGGGAPRGRVPGGGPQEAGSKERDTGQDFVGGAWGEALSCRVRTGKTRGLGRLHCLPRCFLAAMALVAGRRAFWVKGTSWLWCSRWAPLSAGFCSPASAVTARPESEPRPTSMRQQDGIRSA